MPNHTTLGTEINVASIRDFLFSGNVEPGDSLVLNETDYNRIAAEFKAGEQPIEIPLTILGLTIMKDTTATLPAGKIHVIKNDSTIE